MPKSLTGFGGLSMSNKQTSHAFRMDIAQTHVPLLIDPKTHKADIKLKLDIPLEGVHPTITKVRGDTLDLRYYVEVCLDVQGKLEETRFLPRLTNQAIHGLGKASSRKSPSVPMSLATQGQQMIDTQAIRRDKPQIVVLTFDLIIGTRDSSRGIKVNSVTKSRRPTEPWSQSGTEMQKQISLQGSENSRGTRLDDVLEETLGEEGPALGSHGTGYNMNIGHNQSPPYVVGSSPLAASQWQHSMSAEELSRPLSDSPPPPPGPPLMLSTGPVDEKTRLRQQEQRLLPSQPDVGSSDNINGPPIVPMVPPAEDSELGDDQIWDNSTGRSYQNDSGYGSSGQGSSSRPMPHRSQTYDAIMPSTVPEPTDWRYATSITSQSSRLSSIVTAQELSSFNFSHGSPSRPTSTQATEDKQELERRRLMEQRSAPSNSEPIDSAAASAGPSILGVPEPTDDHDAFGEWDNNQEGLPKYENLD